MSDVKFVEPAAFVADLANSKEIQIVDVRDASEFASGHIKNAINISSDKWADSAFVESFVNSYEGPKTIIFHCAKSVQRGPTCARAFLAQLNVARNGDANAPEV